MGNGAHPTPAVHKILENFGLLPKRPVPHGSKYMYEKPEKQYSDHIMNVYRMMHRTDADSNVKRRLLDELNLLESQYGVEGSTYNPNNIENVKTTDIDSDDPDIFERNIKFEELKRRFEKHRQYSLDVLKGNDYRFNIYLRKMNKLSRSKYGGLDVEGYRDYLNNLMEFKKIKRDFFGQDDPLRDDRLDIDYSKDPEKSKIAGKARKVYYNIDHAATMTNKVERMQALKATFVEILKDEIESHRKFENDNENKILKDLNLYKKYRDNEGYAERFRLENELLDNHFKRDVHRSSAKQEVSKKASKKAQTEDAEDDYFEDYDSTEEEVTLKIVEYLHENPHLFRKIRFLQRDNKSLDPEEIPELRRLQILKQHIVSYYLVLTL